MTLINEADTDHTKAKTIRDRLLNSKKRFLITDYIILEIANSLCKRRWRTRSVKLLNSIREIESIEVVEIDKKISEKAWDMYSARTDKEWSLTDCASFVVMKQYGIQEAFTNDHYFEQAEFAVLMK